MKKIMAFACVVVILLSFIACGKDSASPVSVDSNGQVIDDNNNGNNNNGNNNNGNNNSDLNADGTYPGGSGTTQYGFPADFPKLVDSGGLGNGKPLEGFGGDTSKNCAANRAAVTRNPVILLHGNAGNAKHAQWGMTAIRDKLYAKGYSKSEVWAVSYLGANNASLDMNNPHQNNIDDVRRFIDTVRKYLNVKKVDIVGHSLGAGMVRAYLMGYQSNGTWNYNNHRLDNVGTLVTMAGANYGLIGAGSADFGPGGPFEPGSHIFSGVNDDTPRGPNSASSMIAPSASWKQTTGLDNNTIAYVALTATKDFVDNQNKDTGRLVGANLNKRYSLGTGTTGHEQIIKNQQVFEDFYKYLNKNGNGPQEAPPVATIQPYGGTIYLGETITVKIGASNNPTSIQYRVDGGSWQNYTSEFTITETCKIEVKAVNQYGTSKVVSADFVKKNIKKYEKIKATITDHYVSGRIDNALYLHLLKKYSYQANLEIYLYRLSGETTWTDINPEA